MQEDQKIGRLEIIQWEYGFDKNGNVKVIPYIYNTERTKKLVLTTGDIFPVSKSLLNVYGLVENEHIRNDALETWCGKLRLSRLYKCDLTIYKSKTQNYVLTIKEIKEITQEAEKNIQKYIRFIEAKELKFSKKRSAFDEKMKPILEAQEESQNF